MGRLLQIVILFIFLLPGLELAGQQLQADTDTVPVEKIIIIRADEGQRLRKEGERALLTGRVELRQGQVFMYCDTAIQENNNLYASGSVHIQQNDTTSIFADSLAYIGDLKQAELFDSVVLISGRQRLFTDRLSYNLHRKVGTYENKALLDNGNSQLRSRRGTYFVDEREVYFRDSVLVVDSAFTLRTDSLKYNTATETVYFLAPTLISQNQSKIYCEEGFYDIPNEQALFGGDPQYQRNGQKATAHLMEYDGNLRQVRLIGEARIEEEDRVATARVIRYDEVNDISYLEGDAVYQDGERTVVSDTITYYGKEDAYSTKGRAIVQDSTQTLLADTLDYDNILQVGIARGNVLWRDTVEDLTIVSQKAFYDNKREYILATGNRPLLISVVDGDSLFMTADTLMSPGLVLPGATEAASSPQPDSTEIAADSLAAALDTAVAAADTAVVTADTARAKKSRRSRVLIAQRDVRIFKSNLQAVCDSLVYHSGDSLFTLFKDPIIWSDTSQFTADTVRIQLARNRIDRIFLRENALILNSPDERFFNQVKGRYITAFFSDDQLRRMRVEGNAESVYYILDDAQAYVGPNAVACSEMLLFFGNNQITDIKFYAAPGGQIIPMKQARHDQIKLEGFNWKAGKARRPMTRADLFVEK